MTQHTDTNGYRYGPTRSELLSAPAGSVQIQRHDGDWVDPLTPPNASLPAPDGVPLWHYRIAPQPERVPAPGECWAYRETTVWVWAAAPHGNDYWLWVKTHDNETPTTYLWLHQNPGTRPWTLVSEAPEEGTVSA
jgi:hypothetical protein